MQQSDYNGAIMPETMLTIQQQKEYLATYLSYISKSKEWHEMNYFSLLSACFVEQRDGGTLYRSLRGVENSKIFDKNSHRIDQLIPYPQLGFLLARTKLNNEELLDQQITDGFLTDTVLENQKKILDECWDKLSKKDIEDLLNLIFFDLDRGLIINEINNRTSWLSKSLLKCCMLKRHIEFISSVVKLKNAGFRTSAATENPILEALIEKRNSCLSHLLKFYPDLGKEYQQCCLDTLRLMQRINENSDGEDALKIIEELNECARKVSNFKVSREHIISLGGPKGPRPLDALDILWEIAKLTAALFIIGLEAFALYFIFTSPITAPLSTALLAAIPLTIVGSCLLFAGVALAYSALSTLKDDGVLKFNFLVSDVVNSVYELHAKEVSEYTEGLIKFNRDLLFKQPPPLETVDRPKEIHLNN